MSVCNHDFVHRVPNCIAPSIAPHWACNVCKQQFVLPSHGADAEARAVMWKDAYDRESTANAALREQLEELQAKQPVCVGYVTDDSIRLLCRYESSCSMYVSKENIGSVLRHPIYIDPQQEVKE